MNWRNHETPCLWNFFKAVLLAGQLLFGKIDAQTIEYAVPRFPQGDRVERVRPIFPDVDRVFEEFASSEHLPGIAYGVVLDGELVHTGGVGLANLELKTPAGVNTAFRIASMTKSFVTLAIFKLRDEGKIGLDDPVGKYLSEFRSVHPPTADSPAVTIRHLMTMSSGLPEDNPWGDRQMAISKDALRAFVSGGLSFSNPPGQEYEYSNLGFVLLGQVISKAAKMPFQRYISEKILKPLRMENTQWEFSHYSADQFALGYRWEHNQWKVEPVLHDGEGAACGGLITTINDFARYVAMHLEAWPARDEPDLAPVRRATLRELHKPQTFSEIATNRMLLDGRTSNPTVGFYGYGLGWLVDVRGMISIGHSGGLPGYGSNYRFLPDYGLGLIAFANRTYAPASRAVAKAIALLLERGQLLPRRIVPSPILETRKTQIAAWITTWDQLTLGKEIAAENFFLDRSREDRIQESNEIFAKSGKILSVGPLQARNQLRGSFLMNGENGSVEVWFTLTPERVPKVQELSLRYKPRE